MRKIVENIGFKLLLASTGLIILGFAAAQTPDTQKIKSIKTSDIGEKITVEGNITDIYGSTGSYSMKIQDSTGTISGASFSNRGFRSGPALLTGRVQMYKGNLQLVIEDSYLKL